MSGHICADCGAWFPVEPALRVHRAYCPVVRRAAGDDDPALTPGRLRHYADVMRGEGYLVAARLMDRGAAKIEALEARRTVATTGAGEALAMQSLDGGAFPSRTDLAYMMQLEHENNTLRAALLRYGQHESTCPWIVDTLPCTCGFAKIEADAGRVVQP